MKRVFSIAVAAALVLLSSCQEVEPEIVNDEPAVTNPSSEGTPATFIAVTENHSTKTALSKNGDVWDVVWKSGDKVKVNGYSLSIEENGQAEGYGPECTKAIFSGNVTGSKTSPKYSAWYPEALGNAAGNLSLPAVQNYVADGVAGFPMYAESDSESLQFMNLCGIVRLNLKGTKNISAIRLLDQSDCPKGLSGSINIADCTASVKSGAEGVTLQCATPVALDSDDFTSFLIIVPAGSYGKLQITVITDDEFYAILTSNKAITVERSKITDISISTLKFKNDKAVFSYTTTNTTQISKYPAGTDASVFGDGLTVVSHTYDASTKTGVITLSGTVTKIGDNAFSGLSTLQAITIPESVTSLGSKAFYNCKALTDISLEDTGITSIGEQAFSNDVLNAEFDIPSTVTSIGGSAFNSCSGLVSITVPDAALAGNTIFNECKNLESVTFTGSTRMTTIPNSTFNGCSKLASINGIPSCVTSIGDGAFKNCGLTSLPDGWGRSGIVYGTAVFAGCPITSITFPDSWTSIPKQFCMNMTQLSSVDFGNGLKSLGWQVFVGCSSLTTVEIPSNVKTIDAHSFYKSYVTNVIGMNRSDLTVGNNAFAESKIQAANISNWTSIPGGCFMNCTDLASVTLGDGLLTISANAFQNCSSLTSVSLPSSLTKMENYVFAGTGLTSLPSGMHDMTFGSSIFKDTPITSVTFPAGLTKTGEYMFSGCTSLTSADLGDVTDLAAGTFGGCSSLEAVDFSSVQYLNKYAFNNCTSLTSAVLPNSLVRMYEHAFDGCTALETVDIGTGLTRIDDDCFHNDNKLETLTIRASSLPALNGSLNKASKATIPLIYVPESLVESYQAASNWSNYSSYFRALGSED